MKGMTLKFKNRPTKDGFETIVMGDCVVANNGSPTTSRPQIMIHLPKSDQRDVDGSFVEYNGEDYHVIGVTVAQMEDNTPTRWDRYAIAEKITAL